VVCVWIYLHDVVLVLNNLERRGQERTLVSYR